MKCVFVLLATNVFLGIVATATDELEAGWNNAAGPWDKDTIFNKSAQLEGPELGSSENLECIQCEHATNPSCTLDPSALKAEACTPPSSSCFVQNINGQNNRGCVINGTPCNPGTDCDICTENGCNNIIFPKNRPVCTTKAGDAEICENLTDKCIGIYTKKGVLDNAGCSSGLALACQSNPIYCMDCEESKCEAKFKVLECYTCGENDDDCVKNPTAVPKPICQIGTRSCFTKNINGRNVRGCQEELQCEGDCSECSTNGCNKARYPSTRKLCNDKTSDKAKDRKPCFDPDDNCLGVYDTVGDIVDAGCQKELSIQCDNSTTFCKECSGTGICVLKAKPLNCITCSAENINCTVNPFLTEPCEKFTQNCYVKLEEGKNIRGCIDFNDQSCGENCDICNTDNCNNQMWPKTRHTCYKCKGEGHCDILKENEKIRPCFDIEDKCFTKLEGSKTIRGCISEDGICEDHNCKTCDEANCNKLDVRSSKTMCYQCDESTRGCGLILNTTSVNPSQCTSKLLYGQKDSCYSMKKNEIKRGCLSDLDQNDEIHRSCINEETCYVCVGDGCNVKDINSAPVLKSTFLLLIVTSFVYI